MAVLKHTHSFIRHSDKDRKPYKDSSGDTIYKCGDPNCMFKVKRVDIIGKATMCPKCRCNEFTLTPEDLRRARPLCMDCRNTKEARQQQIVRAMVNNMVNSNEAEIVDGGMGEELYDGQ